jgi:hypothetical protein
VTLPYSSLSNYIHNVTINGVSRPVIGVQHRTQISSGNTWYNAVWLQNITASTYDLIYSYFFTSSTAEQKGDGTNAEWGPIVETFQNSYQGTNPMGFQNFYCESFNSSGTGSGWALLSSSQSYIRNDGVGFSTSYLAPNYTFIAVS